LNVPAVAFEKFGFTYTDRERPALADIAMSVNEGESVLITGPAGAGKTTLCSALNGLVPHFFTGRIRGRVLVKGIDTKRSNIARLSHIVGMLFQDPSDQLVSPTVEDDVAFGPENYGVPREEIQRRVTESLALVRLAGYEKRVPYTLSGGEQQACALAGVIAMRPDILVLDEPTSNLDPLGSSQVLEIVSRMARRHGRTLLVVEHRLEEFVPLCDRLVVMEDGRLALEGAVDDLFSEENARAMEAKGVRLPQVTLLALRLRERGLWPQGKRLPATVEEAARGLAPHLRKGGSPGPGAGGCGGRGGKPVIEVQGLWHVYPNGTPALRGIDLAIAENEFVAIVGQNGSGKTTLVKHFNGLLRPTKGRVVVGGMDAGKESIARLSRKVGYCFQNPDHQMCCRTVREELLFGPGNLKMDESSALDRMAEIAAGMKLEQYLDRGPFQLSKGERQKLAVAAILMMGPDVIVIDEPTTGQDYRMGREMMDLAVRLHREGKTVVVITHDMGIVAEYVDRVIVLRDGELLLDGTPREVFAKPDVISTTSLEPPQVARLVRALADFGLRGDVLTVGEMVEEVSARWAGGA
jgi:energy-coupling factor transport system ATP-binding protein